MTTDQPTLGAVLRDLRHASGLSLRALAADLGITFQALGHYERDDRGDYGPPDRILDAYAALSDDPSYTRDLLYFLAGKLAPEITAFLLADVLHVRTLRLQEGISHPRKD